MALKKNYPVESELLLQAIRYLRMAKISLADSKLHNYTAHIPSLLLDPRYELLKRHRGFFKVWEALEDFCRMILGKITGKKEYEYNQKACFFKTKSAQLVEEADLLLQKEAATYL
jgi:hypothetical protein